MVFLTERVTLPELSKDLRGIQIFIGVIGLTASLKICSKYER